MNGAKEAAVATNLLPPEYIGDPMAPRSANLSPVPTPVSVVDRPGAKRAMRRSPVTIVAMVLLLGFIAAGVFMLVRASDETPTNRGMGHGPTHRG